MLGSPDGSLVRRLPSWRQSPCRPSLWLVVLFLIASCGNEAVGPDSASGQLTATTASAPDDAAAQSSSAPESTTTSSSPASSTSAPSSEESVDAPAEPDTTAPVVWTPELLDQLHVVASDFQLGQWSSAPSEDMVFFDSPCSLQQPQHVYASSSDLFVNTEAALQVTSSWLGFGSAADAIGYMELWRTELPECPAVRMTVNVGEPEEFGYANTAITSNKEEDIAILTSVYVEDEFVADQVGIFRRHGAAVFQAASTFPGPRPPELAQLVEDLADLLSQRAVEGGLPKAGVDPGVGD